MHRRVYEATTAPVEFGEIPHDDWFQPSWINETLATGRRKELTAKGIIYAGTGIPSVRSHEAE